MSSVLHTHYSRVFAATHRTDATPSWLEAVYEPKASIDARIYTKLMTDVEDEELAKAVGDADYVCAAGVDDVSAGVWRLLCKSPAVREMVCAFTSACIRLRVMPSIGKRSIIIPIPKKKNGGRGLDNIRPIALQCALTKILTKILATRLATILSANHVLHCAQEGFLPGGQSQACVDVLLDAMEGSAQRRTPLHVLFYDLMQAYDSVRVDDLLASLRRLRIPDSFIELVRDALIERVAVVRTAFGDTDDIDVGRSIPQGDPWAPLLFVCFLDSLHCGFESNPLYHGVNDGVCVPGAGLVASKGFADDTVIMSTSYRGLRRLHHWAIAWVRWHCMRFHAGKCVLTGRTSDDTPLVNQHIRIDGVILSACAWDAAIRYLGATLEFGLSPAAQVTTVTQRIAHFCNALQQHQLRVDRAIYAINTFLVPSLAYCIVFVQPSSSQAASWDKQVARTVMRLSGPDPVRGMKPAALATITGLILPSSYERAVKISEAYLRINGSLASSHSARCRWLDRRAESSSWTNRLVRINSIAHEAGVHLERMPRSNRAWRSEDHYPDRVNLVIATVDDVVCPLVCDYYGIWGAAVKWPMITMCTDGSVQGRGDWQVSSWSVIVIDDWFRSNWHTIPPEGHFRANTLAGAAFLSGRVTLDHGQGVFDAELQGIARGLLAVPVSCAVLVWTDSKSTIDALKAYAAEPRDRARLRMPGRQWLSLIHRLIACRLECGASTTILWIKAHSDEQSIEHVGNRCADELAKRASAPAPLHISTSLLPLEQEEPWLMMREWTAAGTAGRLITADPRRVCFRKLASCAQVEWTKSETQSLFSSPDVDGRALWKLVRTCLPRLCGHVLRFLTDTAHWYRPLDGGAAERRCVHCDTLLTTMHVVCCPLHSRRRQDAANNVRDLLAPYPDASAICNRWMADHDSDVRTLLVRLGLASGPTSSVAVAAASFGAFRQDTAVECSIRWHVPKLDRQQLLDRIRSTLFVWASRAWFLATN